MPEPRQQLLAIENLGLTLGRKTLLEPHSFTLRAGECVALTGPNGSGKTTLLRIVTGKQPASSGHFSWNEDLVPDTAMSLVLGGTPFYENMTVGEHLGLIAASWGLPAENVDDLMTTFDMTHIRDSFIEELSSGERQLLCLAMGLLRPATVIILDEPEQRLDQRRRGLLGEVLEAKKSENIGVLMASHDQDLVDRVADVKLQL